MEAALCLRYGNLPSISLRTISTPAFTKLYFGFNRSSISVSTGGFTVGRRCRRQVYGLGPLALNRSNSSMPSGNDNGHAGKVVGSGAIGASLALACALSIIGCGCKMNLKAYGFPQPKLNTADSPPSNTVDSPPWTDPKKMALESLLDVSKNLSKKTKWRPVAQRSSTLCPSTKDISQQIKKKAVSEIKQGNPVKALDMLKEEYKKCEKAEPWTGNWPKDEGEPGYNLRMAMVEILICQGKYEEASKFIRDQDVHSALDRAQKSLIIFDARPILYKAILCTMSIKDEEQEKAQQLWEKFADTDQNGEQRQGSVEKKKK